MKTTRPERGAITTIVALAIVALLACAALVIDIGLGWQSRRNLVTTTDAAALAAGNAYAAGSTGCNTVAANYVNLNAPGATMTSCTSSLNGNAGTVTVDAEQDINAIFGRVVGLNDLPTASSTTVQWGPPSGATGLRPFGLCSEAPGMASFLANTSSTQTHRIAYTKDSPNQCGGNNVPGNWGTINFDGGGGGANETRDWVDNGYDGSVFSGTAGGDCGSEAFACYPGSTGADAGVANAVRNLRDSGIYFGLPIYDLASGNGSNAQYHVVGFARVRIVDFQFNGQESQRFIELEFRPGVLTGSCCNPGGPQTNAVAIAICAVDNKNLGAC